MQKNDKMNKELLIRSSSNNVDFALLKDGKLIEFHKDNENTKFLVGDIYLAKIRKTMPALNAAFVNVGYKKDAFLHYHDLGPKISTLQNFLKGVSSGKIKNASLKDYKFENEIDKNGAIGDVLSPNQSVLIQIVKEPISTKGPRVTSELSIAGRFLVLVPFFLLFLAFGFRLQFSFCRTSCDVTDGVVMLDNGRHGIEIDDFAFTIIIVIFKTVLVLFGWHYISVCVLYCSHIVCLQASHDPVTLFLDASFWNIL